MTIAFFENCWEVVRGEVMGMILSLFETSAFDKSRNAPFVALMIDT